LDTTIQNLLCGNQSLLVTHGKISAKVEPIQMVYVFLLNFNLADLSNMYTSSNQELEEFGCFLVCVSYHIRYTKSTAAWVGFLSHEDPSHARHHLWLDGTIVDKLTIHGDVPWALGALRLKTECSHWNHLNDWHMDMRPGR
jgi:hypothetical protein